MGHLDCGGVSGHPGELGDGGVGVLLFRSIGGSGLEYLNHTKPGQGRGFDKVGPGLNYGRIEFKAHDALEQLAFEFNECGVLRINRGICFKTLKSRAEGLSETTIRYNTTHKQEASR